MSGHSDHPEETRIRSLLENWADAVRRHDISAILAHHEPDMVMFDLPPPPQCKGIQAYEKTWDLLFRYHKAGTAFDIQETRRNRGAGRRLCGGDHAMRSGLVQQPGEIKMASCFA